VNGIGADALEQVVIVLFEPQDDINIGNTIRAAKNFGIHRVRLVSPASGDAARIAISAPKADDVIAALERFEGIDDALADCVYVVGLTARRRKASWSVVEPRGAARDVMQMAAQGKVALVFGREDSGLPNEILDRCHGIVTIPTNPNYSSINLGQSVLLMVWEIFRVATEVEESRVLTEAPVVSGDGPGLEPGPQVQGDMASMERMERMFAQAEQALRDIEFFKADNHEHIMRTVRNVLLRARMEAREAAMFHGIFREISAYLERTSRRS
jgi:TrmH family RNA methyltransferase